MVNIREIIFDFNRDWIDGKIVMDYRWTNENGKEYYIYNIPCKKLPFGNDDYLDKRVDDALCIVIDLQGKDDFEEKFNFEDIEDILDDLIEELS